MNDRSFRVAGTYTTINTSTVYHEGDIDEFDLEQLDLEDDEDLEDLDSEDDCKFYLDLELFHLNELNLDDINLDGLDEDDKRTLTQWLKRRSDVRILHQGRQVSQQQALQLVTGNDTARILGLGLQADDKCAMTNDGDSEAAESSVGDPATESVKELPVIDGDDWMQWCE